LFLIVHFKIIIKIAMKTLQSRRDFLRMSVTGALGALVISRNDLNVLTANVRGSVGVDPKTFGIGLQLYTVREAMQKDVPGTLQKVSEIGYKYLELASYNIKEGKFYGHTPAEFNKMVRDLGMEIISSHAGVPRDVTADQAKKMADDHAKLGAKYCIQPYVADDDRKSVASYQKLVAEWNMVAGLMKENGVQFGYHNHNFEFATVEGKIPYFDILLTELDKDLVIMELDLFWASKAGQNPVDLFKKYPGRFHLFHMKDMGKNEEPSVITNSDDMVPVGTGVINFKEILDAKKTAGMKYMFVEQDNAGKGDAFAAIQTSITNLTTKILA
jgi:sugar phosphate isomerase/epimerase